MRDPKELERKRKELRAREADNLKAQCEECKLCKPHKSTDCRIRVNLVVKDSPVAWNNKHLFFDDRRRCKMFVPKKEG